MKLCVFDVLCLRYSNNICFKAIARFIRVKDNANTGVATVLKKNYAQDMKGVTKLIISGRECLDTQLALLQHYRMK